MATRTFTFDSTSDYPSVVDLVVNVGASFTCTYTVNDTSGTACLLYTSPSPRDVEECRMPSSS